MLISSATSRDESKRSANVALLPVGSFEQHGSHLPLSTDTLVGCAIAKIIAEKYPEVRLLPPITVSCSHEHAEFAGTVSISSRTLHLTIQDIASSLGSAGVKRLVIVNAHGGNYILSNFVQESNIASRAVALYPRSEEWNVARKTANLETTNHEDMHGGEAETSILLATCPEVVRKFGPQDDHIANDRRHLLTLGMSGYTQSGIIGRPSLATAEKGHALLESFAQQFKGTLDVLKSTEPSSTRCED